MAKKQATSPPAKRGHFATIVRGPCRPRCRWHTHPDHHPSPAVARLRVVACLLRPSFSTTNTSPACCWAQLHAVMLRKLSVGVAPAMLLASTPRRTALVYSDPAQPCPSPAFQQQTVTPCLSTCVQIRPGRRGSRRDKQRPSSTISIGAASNVSGPSDAGPPGEDFHDLVGRVPARIRCCRPPSNVAWRGILLTRTCPSAPPRLQAQPSDGEVPFSKFLVQFRAADICSN